MPHLPNRWRMLAVGTCCAAAGAGASAIATAGASTSHSTTKTKPAPAHTRAHSRAHARGGVRGLARRAVHGSVVVRTKSGFGTVTFDRGTVKSVSGDQLTLTEGTAKQTYKTVTLTIPSAAKVHDDGHLTSLSSVKAGQRATVLALPKRTVVVAHTPKHKSA